MKYLFSTVLVIILLCICASALYAQPGGGGPCPNPPCNNPIPITGIEYLLAAGAALGIRQLVKSKKN